MKKIFLLVLLLLSLNCYSQKNVLEEVVLSPNEKLIAFTYYDAEGILDIFTYDLENNTTRRATNSYELKSGRQSKNCLNWIDNERLILISKPDGFEQQYILDIKKNTFDLESPSTGKDFENEYALIYSKTNNRSYYTAFRNGKEPAVYSKVLGEKEEKKISKGKVNSTLMSVSPDGKYLEYEESIISRSHFISLEKNKEISLKLPKTNIRILAWSSSSDKFIYTHTYYLEKGKPAIDLKIYDLITHKQTEVEIGIETKVEFEMITGTGHRIEIETSRRVKLGIEPEIEIGTEIVGIKHIIEHNTGQIMEFSIEGIWSPCEDYFYSLSDKSYLVDISSNTKREYNVAGEPISFLNNCQSVLFKQNNRMFILDLLDGSIRDITLII